MIEFHIESDDIEAISAENIRKINDQYSQFNLQPKSILSELDAIRDIAKILSPAWKSRSVSDHLPKDEEKKPGDQLIGALEELIALEAARWTGGALARIWTIVGSLALASVALLLAVTSYPFPEQPRAMTLVGIVIAALVVLILRIVVGTNRDEALSLLADNTPGRVSWNTSLFGNLATYVFPLVGILVALSFEATDLFRSILGPILKLFP